MAKVIQICPRIYQMGIITLTTDLGLKDFYVASLKGKLYRHCPDVNIVDITHQVRPFDVIKAAYHISCCYADFPDGTIHVMGVASEPDVKIDTPDTNQQLGVLLFKNQYFISNDNGFFGLLLGDEKPQGYWNIDVVYSNPNVLKDAAKNILLEAAIKLYQGVAIETFAVPAENYRLSKLVKAAIVENSIYGEVVHIDDFGNIITNIMRSDYDKFGSSVPFKIKIGIRGEHVIDRISGGYREVEDGALVAIFNSNNRLEIALNKGADGAGGGVATLFRYHEGSQIRMAFNPKGSSSSFEELF